jgi:hypothetical protein
MVPYREIKASLESLEADTELKLQLWMLSALEERGASNNQHTCNRADLET